MQDFRIDTSRRRSAPPRRHAPCPVCGANPVEFAGMLEAHLPGRDEIASPSDRGWCDGSYLEVGKGNR